MDVYKIKVMNVEQARQVLKQNGFFVDNLWNVYDVKSRYNCDDETAQHILNQALTNDATMEQVWLSIGIFAEMENLKPKEDEQSN